MPGGFFKRVLPTLSAQRLSPGHDGRMHLLEGRRGRGKSYTMTYWLRQFVLARVPVVCNFGVDRYRLAVHAYMAGSFSAMGEAMEWTHTNVRTAKSWDDIFLAYNGGVIIDEAVRIFDSRNKKAAPAVAFEWTQQSRKFRLTLILASQSFDWLDVRIRQLSDLLWQLRKETNKKTGLPTRFWAYGLDPWAQGLSESAVRSHADFQMRIKFDPAIATLYDSWERIALLGAESRYPTVKDIDRDLVSRGIISETTLLKGADRIPYPWEMVPVASESGAPAWERRPVVEPDSSPFDSDDASVYDSI